MNKKSLSQSGVFDPRAFAAFLLCATGVMLAVFSFAAPTTQPTATLSALALTSTPTFGHPIISSIGGVGFE